MVGKLYIIPTPIGNLADITIRAIDVLKEIDVLFCEDTREIGKILAKYEIKTKLISNNDINEAENISKMLNYCQVGIVSDRGTPLISDPGYKLVQAAIKNGWEIISLPGPCAITTALPLSGFSANEFVFLGYLSKKKNQRQKQIQEIANYNMTTVIYETPHRLVKTLQEMQENLGDQEIFISREITKRFETHYRGKISEVIPQLNNVKGEIVLIVGAINSQKTYSDKQIKEMVNFILAEEKDLKQAIGKTAQELNLTRNEVYKKYHDL